MPNILRQIGRRGSISVEFALIAVFCLVPLVGGSVDMLEYISAKAQLNTALQTLYYYGLSYSPGNTSGNLTDPVGTSSSPGIITSTNANAVVALMNSRFHPLTLTGISITYDCITNGATTVTYTASTAATTSSVNGVTITGTNNGCAPGTTQRTRVTFTVRSKVTFTMPMPFVTTNPLVLTETSTVQIY